MLKRPGGKDRLDNLEVSYEISINGPRMDDSARRFLSALSMLPSGVAHGDIPVILPDADRAASALRKAGLAFDEAGRLRVLAPLREYVSAEYPADGEALESIISLYIGMVRLRAGKVGRSGGAEAVARLEPETANVEAIFPAALETARAEEAIVAAVYWAEFIRFTGLGSATCIESAARTAESRRMTLLQAFCVQCLGDIALDRSNYNEARRQYKAALTLYRQSGLVLGEANCIQGLGDIALRRSDYDEARRRYEEEALPMFRQIGDILGEANCITGLGNIALEQSNNDKAGEKFEKARSLYRQKRDILGEANCIKSLGDIALRRSNHDEARTQYETALKLYSRIPDPYSIGGTHRRLARIARNDRERRRHVKSARESWKSIDRTDLIAELDEEFGADS
jgi:tetratricopeptide (TPR) repeat protein